MLLLVMNTLLLKPRKIELKNVKKEYDKTSEQLNNALELGKEETSRRIKQELQSWFTTIDGFVIGFEDIENLKLEVNRIANEVRLSEFVSKTKTSAEDIPGCENIKEGRLNVTFLGTFKQFALFINKLERNKPVIFVDKFKITRSDKDTLHKASMALTFLVRKKSNYENTAVRIPEKNSAKALSSNKYSASKV